MLLPQALLILRSCTEDLDVMRPQTDSCMASSVNVEDWPGEHMQRLPMLFSWWICLAHEQMPALDVLQDWKTQVDRGANTIYTP